MDLGLEGRVALITGGTRGIGRATALRLAAEGAHVVVTARGQERIDETVHAVRAAGDGDVLGVAADANVAEDLERVLASAIDRFGHLDILINNVGTSARGGFLMASDEDWHSDLDNKLMSAIRLSRGAIPVMPERGGRIINVLSILGKAPGGGSSPTSVTRAAGLALTKVLSKEFAERGVLVNAVCVGFIRSGQHDDRWEREERPGTIEAFYADEAVRRGIPVGRVGEAEEVADVIAFLASDRASYVSGTAINVDGALSSTT